MDFKIITEEFKKLGFETSEFNDFIFYNEIGSFYVTKKESGYHEIAYCPREHFDRWAICRFINFETKVVNYNEEHKYGWKEENVKKDFIKKVKESIELGELIPNKFFDGCLNVNF